MLHHRVPPRFVAPLLALALAAWGCSTSSGAPEPDALAEVAAEVLPEADGLEAQDKELPGEEAAPEAQVAPWAITLTPAAEPATPAHLGLAVLDQDPQAGTFRVRLASGAIAGLFGLSFHLGWDPQALEIVKLDKVFPADLGTKAWAVAARADQARGRVVGGVAVLRGKDPFGQNPPPEHDLPDGTALVEATFRVLQAGDTALKLGFPDSVALDAKFAPLALETIDLRVSVQAQGGEQ
jgi:hypothetical protein